LHDHNRRCGAQLRLRRRLPGTHRLRLREAHQAAATAVERATMAYNLLEPLELLEREKGVPADTILAALSTALVSASTPTPAAAEEARVTIDADTAEIIVYGQEPDEDGNVVNEWEDTPEDFGRIAAQTAKQVIMQRLRDAKREQVF